MRILTGLALALATVSGPAWGQSEAAKGDPDPRYAVPATVSPEAAAILAPAYAGSAKQAQPAWVPPTAQDWIPLAAQVSAGMEPASLQQAQAMGVVVAEGHAGPVPVVRVTPAGYKPRKRVLLYLHGGGYVLFSAKGTLVVPALMTKASGIEVVSIDYTLAPRGDWKSITDQVVIVYQAFLANGYDARAIGVFGDSAGGGLAAGAVLKMRDKGLPLPGALYLLSPWSDITATGDTYVTLGHSDPILDLRILASAAAAYAAPADQKNPYVSPVYGDYSKPFPPTLIQGGTHEMFVSNIVRQYQAIAGGGHEAVLDLYEGMPHVFPALAPSAPETTTAIGRAAAFFQRHLSVPQEQHP